MKKNNIAAIVVTYNRCNLLLECIDALLGQYYSDFDIFVIDNNSTDGTDNVLRKYIINGTIKYFNTGKNIGGAGGFNEGIKKAYSLGYKFFWLMDDDTIPMPNALEELVKVGKQLKNTYGYLVSKALWIDGTLCKMNIPEFTDGKNIISYNYQDTRSITRGTFVSFFVPKDIVKQVGLPIKEFFVWGDDTNYCLRINRIGTGYWVEKSIVIHKMKSNQSAYIVTCPWERPERFIYAYRNRFFNYRMEHKLASYFWIIIKQTVLILLKAKNNKINRIRTMLTGVIQGVSFRPIIEYVDEETRFKL